MYHKLTVSYRNINNKMNNWITVCHPRMQYRHAGHHHQLKSKSSPKSKNIVSQGI